MLVSAVFSHTLIVPVGLASALVVVVGPSDGDDHCMAVEYHFWGHAETACQTSRSVRKARRRLEGSTSCCEVEENEATQKYVGNH